VRQAAQASIAGGGAAARLRLRRRLGLAGLLLRGPVDLGAQRQLRQGVREPVELGPHPSQAASVEVDELAFEVGQVRSRAMRDLGGGGGAIR